MPITDERRIRFDVGALKDVLKFSQFAALAVGLPSTDPSDIILNPSARVATFNFVDAAITLEVEKLGALLISYCIRSSIRIPRKGTRSVLVEPTTITLVFHEDYAITPAPTSTMPDQARPRAMTWAKTTT